MQNQYGPSIVLGLIIGAAIIADDFIRPHPPHRQMRMAAEHPTPHPDSDHKVWVMKQGVEGHAEARHEMRIMMKDDSAGASQEKTVIMVKVDDDAIDAETSGEALADAIRDVVDVARAEGREPTESEIRAAVSAVSGATSHIEVEVDVSEVSPSEGVKEP